MEESHSLRQRSRASLHAGEVAADECSPVQACRGVGCAAVCHCVQGGACADCRGGGEPVTEEVSACAGEAAAEELCSCAREAA
jgi:hypothetical protein